MRLGALTNLLKQTFADWSKDGAPRLAAALSYYTLFSLAPLLVIVIAVAGLVFGREAVQGHLVAQIDGLVGRDGGHAIEELVAHASQPAKSVVAAVIGFVVLLFGAAGVLVQLEDALNIIWEVPARPSVGVMGWIRARLLSFVFVLGVGFLLLVSLTVSASLEAVQSYATAALPGNDAVWLVINHLTSLALVTLLFALMFKFLPNAAVRWSDVWVGAFFTSILFTLGKMLVGIYLGRASIGSAYGAAGSLVVVMVWVYYSAQILFFGAELTQVYARLYGSQILTRGATRDTAAADSGPHSTVPISAG